jgi:hypothetical protein
VLVDDARILNRHLPACERDQSGSEGDVLGVEG